MSKGRLSMRGIPASQHLQLRILNPMIVGSKAIDYAMSNGVVELEAGEAGYPVLSKESSNLSSVGGQIYQYCNRHLQGSPWVGYCDVKL